MRVTGGGGGLDGERAVQDDSPYRISRELRGEQAVLVKAPVDPTDERSAASLRREHQMLVALDVAGIIEPLALDERDGVLALVLKDVGGEGLEQLLSRGALGTDAFLAVASQMARVVAAVHERNILLGSLRPESFFVSERCDTATLVDCASATMVPGPVTARAAGSLRYAAPEQTGRLRRSPDQRADLYSLGAIFYEMLTGRPPFPSADPAELVHAHLAINPVAPAIMNPGIPRPLSDITLRLLAKAPEERYQSAEAVLADLDEARARWRASGTIAPFELARDELARELPLPGHLYAREGELAVMTEALERTLAGGRELLVLGGRGGVGKSALFAQFAATAEPRCRVVSGKCDLLAGSLPYAPLLEAFDQIVADLLELPEAQRADTRRRIEEATAPNTRLLVDLLPRLGAIVGEPPPVPSLGSQEAQNRFHMVLQSFLRVVAAERPLVCFVDDLQWADAATLRLLPILIEDPGLHQLLLVVAYRSEEVDDAHPLHASIELGRKAGVTVTTIDLAPLDVAHTTALLADALRASAPAIAPLAETVHRKTGGNPLFMRRFLRHLHRAGLLVFDRRVDTWRWDLHRIAEAPVTDNVVDLLVAAIGKLSPETQTALAIAACIGARFDLEEVAAVAEASVESTARALSTALEEDLIAMAWSQTASLRPAFRFTHDRIQQAAYSTLPDDDRRRLHLRIGRRWLAASPMVESRIFEIADQLNLAADVVTDPVERLELVELNLRAGVFAKARSAPGSALVYLSVGLHMLRPDAAQLHHALWFQLHREAAECAGLSGEHARADALIAAALPRAASVQEKAELYEIQIFGQTLRGALGEALRSLGEALRSLGVSFPEGDRAAAATAEVDEARRLLASASDRLLEAPLLRGDDLSFVRILASALPAASYADPGLLTWLSARLVTFTLQHGPAPQSCFGLSMFAMALLGLRDYLTARNAGQLAIRLAERLGNPLATTRATFMYAGLVSFWVAPIRASVPLLKRAKSDLLAVGDHQFAPWNSMDLVNLMHAQGCPLDTILAEIDYGLELSRRLDHEPVATFLTLYGSGLREIIGNAPAIAPKRFEAASQFNTCLYQILRLQMSYILGDLATARSMASAAAANLPFIGGMFFALVDYATYTALTLAELAASAEGNERAALLARIGEHQRDLEMWAQRCPENVRHKCSLVAAEVARVEQPPLQAARLYQQAIDGAAREEFLHDLALAEERIARLYLRLGLTRDAEQHLAEAMRAYSRWGATAKVRALAREFPRIGGEAGRATRGAAPDAADLDVRGILRAAETLAREVELPRLLDKLMRICLETAGAEWGLLILEEAGAPVIRSTATPTTVSIEHAPLASASRLARALVEHVRRTGETVVLDDVRLTAFASEMDPAHEAERSVMAVPLRRAERISGVLVLENHLVFDAFSPERARALDLLSRHISVAIENSLLFEAQRRAENDSQLLADASAAFAESLDYEGILQRVVRFPLPNLAESCAIDLVEEGRLRRVAVAHVDRTLEPILAEAGAGVLDLEATHPSAQVVRTGRPLLLATIDEAMLRTTMREERETKNTLALGIKSAIVVPLVARGNTFAALSLGARQPGRYSERDLALAHELGRRAGTAIDNARLYGEAQSAVRVRDEFLSVASHELRTPLTSLKLVMQGLVLKAIPLTEANLSRTFGVAARQIARLTRLIDELLNVSRIRAGRLALELEDVDLAHVVRDAADRLAEDFGQAGCELSLQLTPMVGRWDKSALDQVVTNILSNAAKFGARAPIEVTIAAHDGKARLAVTDRGIGIAPDRLAQIFERYERGVSARQYGGLGLGLYIAKAIVEALGGSIWATSPGPERGATFTVELPLVVGERR